MAEGRPTTCSACHERLTTYYTAGEFIVVCPACRQQILTSTTRSGSATRRLFRAASVGMVAAIIAAVAWYTFTKLIGWGVIAVATVLGLTAAAWIFKRHKPLQFSGPFTTPPAPPR
jgi:predicted RNA-binding Zn-ribbon protein involved in translation (DUF1610 family)